jgi:hypothetical protein
MTHRVVAHLSKIQRVEHQKHHPFLVIFSIVAEFVVFVPPAPAVASHDGIVDE